MDYITVSKEAEEMFEEKRSKFIGSICPVENERQALEFISSIKAKNPQARHVVYAYILRANNTVRYSDAGEPSGTGGQPVLNVLQKEGITDVCVTVTRYFGGILLGAGGLTRAYAKGAKIAVDAAGKAQMRFCKVFSVTCSYQLHPKLVSSLEREDCFLGETEYGEFVTLTFAAIEENCPHLLDIIREVSADKAKCTQIDEKYIKFEIK